MTYLSGHLSVGFMQPGPGILRRSGLDLCNQVSETATTENNILSERRYSDRSSKCLGRLRILIWKAENASGGKGILLNSEEVRYMQFESNSEFAVKKIGVRIKVRVH